MIEINLEKDKDKLKTLRAGDQVLLTGTIYSARDAAHKRLKEAIDRGEELPFSLKGSTVYYMGPSPAKRGQVIGSCGPTTSSRMDAFAPDFYDRGMLATIGKGRRSPEVTEAIKRNKALYFAAVGGAGALMSSCIKKADVIAYEDLMAEAVLRLEVEKMPLVVAIDSTGNCVYS